MEKTHGENLIGIESRRYIGCKAKLSDWIMNTIKENISHASSFCDLFAGTGVIAKCALASNSYDRVIINDFLYSNNIIYNAFFGQGEWDEKRLKEIADKFNRATKGDIQDNWFSINYGGKYFDYTIAKQIGYVREEIEKMKETLTDKEYAILMASLIYTIDGLANTVGHFEAFIKRDIPTREMTFKIVDAHSYNTVQIFKEDANILSKKLEADIFYIDPPYNSRQYSRFYHVYETLVKWDKPPLYGTALKPKPANMSDYCRSEAPKVFENLIENLNAKYIVVSYNNTYTSKSHSSENKIKIEQITETLNKKGITKIFAHDYHAFNAGKTDIKGHKEYLFITKVNKKTH